MKTRNKIFLTTYLGIGLVLSEIAIQEINEHDKNGTKINRWSGAHIQTMISWPIALLEGSVKSFRKQLLNGEPLKTANLRAVKDQAE